MGSCSEWPVVWPMMSHVAWNSLRTAQGTVFVQHGHGTILYMLYIYTYNDDVVIVIWYSIDLSWDGAYHSGIHYSTHWWHGTILYQKHVCFSGTMRSVWSRFNLTPKSHWWGCTFGTGPSICSQHLGLARPKKVVNIARVTIVYGRDIYTQI